MWVLYIHGYLSVLVFACLCIECMLFVCLHVCLCFCVCCEPLCRVTCFYPCRLGQGMIKERAGTAIYDTSEWVCLCVRQTERQRGFCGAELVSRRRWRATVPPSLKREREREREDGTHSNCLVLMGIRYESAGCGCQAFGTGMWKILLRAENASVRVFL